MQVLEQYRGLVPSLFAKEHDGFRSNRYSFVDTLEVIERMGELGWEVSGASQVGSRNESKKEHAKHFINFQDKGVNALSLPDIRNPLKPIVPQVVFSNSSNGTSSSTFIMGLLVMICTNGLVVSKGDSEFYKHPHIRFDTNDAKNVIGSFIDKVGGVTSIVKRMQDRALTPRELETFTEKVIEIRYPSAENTPDNIRNLRVKLNTYRREEDLGDDLWSTMNRVQENSIRHTTSYASRNGRKGTSRKLTNPVAILGLNEKIWTLAESYIN